MQAHELIKRFSLPEQTSKRLSFCASGKVQRVADWASFLRPTQVEQTSAVLYKALPEVNTLKATPRDRFEMLELLRPYVQNAILGLSKLFLNQPINLQLEAHKSVLIAQSLQKNMIDGYILVVRDVLLSKKRKMLQEDFFATSLHRAMTGISLLFIRSYQIYTQPPQGLWLSLHTLFRIADECELLDKRITDENEKNTKFSTLEQAYLRSVLLDSSRPHQLNQNDLRALYDAFSEWVEYVRFDLGISNDLESFYYVNLDRDCGPMYKSRIGDDEANELCIELKIKPLLSQLTKHSRDAVEEVSSAIKVPLDVSKAAMAHLLESWSNVSQRKQDRKSSQITAEVSVGLTDCHRQLCNGQDFETFVSNSSDAGSSINASIGGFTPAESFAKTDDTEERNIRVEVQNVSQGGYCLVWHSDTPLLVQSGDLIAVKEFGKRLWTVGVVRWIRQKKHASQLGMQTLSDKAQPYAIAQNYDMGGQSDYMRALFLPAVQFADIPATLLTPSAPFQEMDRVNLLDGDRSVGAKLNKQLFSTSAIQQFTFRTTDSPKAKNTAQNGASQW